MREEGMGERQGGRVTRILKADDIRCKWRNLVMSSLFRHHIYKKKETCLSITERRQRTSSALNPDRL